MKTKLKWGLIFSGVWLPSYLLATIVKDVFEGISRFGEIMIQSVFTILLTVCFLSIIALSSLEKRISELEAEVKKKEQ